MPENSNFFLSTLQSIIDALYRKYAVYCGPYMDPLPWKTMSTKVDPEDSTLDIDSDSSYELSPLIPLANRGWFLRLILFPIQVKQCPIN